MARPTKCNEERTRRVCEALRIGVSIETAMELAGLSHQSYHNWRQRGETELNRVRNGHNNCSVRKEEACFVEFFEATTRAIAESERWLVEQVRKEAPNDWRAAMTMLERRFSERWSKKEKREFSGPGGGPLQTANVNLETDDPKELQRMYHALLDD